MFELTGEYTIILPLMLVVIVATGVNSVISADTVYTRNLLRRGIDIDPHRDEQTHDRVIALRTDARSRQTRYVLSR